MDCTKARDRLSEYQDGALDTAAEAELAAHLRGCGDCAAVAESLAAVRKRLRDLSPAAAPPELLAGVLAGIGAEGWNAGGDSASPGAVAPKSFLSRFRIPLEAAAALLLFASVYWYQRTSPPSAPPASISTTQAPGTASRSGVSSATPGVAPSGPKERKEEAAGARRTAPSAEAFFLGADVPRAKPKTSGGRAPAAGAAVTPRTWTAADLPAVPALRASTDSERIVPSAPPSGPAAEGPADAEAPAFVARRSGEVEEGADFPPLRVFAAPPSRLLRPLPYGRDVVLNVEPEHRDGAE
ncbi:MAG TPA: zf-HC2 domain-containing protein, partial [Candidatus Methylomirabilis sp.]|nr:zf-HC2 domain-containing protein [Candidatus Methylomirabilis sp.]